MKVVSIAGLAAALISASLASAGAADADHLVTTTYAPATTSGHVTPARCTDPVRCHGSWIIDDRAVHVAYAPPVVTYHAPVAPAPYHPITPVHPPAETVTLSPDFMGAMDGGVGVGAECCGGVVSQRAFVVTGRRIGRHAAVRAPISPRAGCR